MKQERGDPEKNQRQENPESSELRKFVRNEPVRLLVGAVKRSQSPEFSKDRVHRIDYRSGVRVRRQPDRKIVECAVHLKRCGGLIAADPNDAVPTIVRKDIAPTDLVYVLGR